MIELTKKRVIRQEYILNAVSGKDVLDIGCVAADRLMDLHKQICASAKSCIGMDINPAEGVVQGDAQNFDFDRKFDVIIAGEVIEHLGNVKGFIDSTQRNLVAGGRLIITTPNPYSFLVLRKAVLGKAVPNDPYHVSLFDQTTIANLFKNYAPSFTGQSMYYEESGTLSLPYKINKMVSGIIPGFSNGILMDLKYTRSAN